MLFFLLFASACAVLQIEECGCTSESTSTNRQNLWQCAIGSASSSQFEHFSSSATYRQAVSRFIVERSSVNRASISHQIIDRTVISRQAVSRQIVDRSAISRQIVEKVAISRSFVNRFIVDRSAVNRAAVYRAAVDKRAVSPICGCLDSVLSCLNSGSCSQSQNTVLESLCNWNFGRLFGDCSSCSTLVQSSSDLATASELVARVQEYEPSLASALVQLVPEITSISFSPKDASSLSASVTLASGVVAPDQAYNQIVYQLSHIFDVYPGTIAWSAPSAKRQISNQQIVINFYDEPLPSSSASVFVPVVVSVIITCLFVLI